MAPRLITLSSEQPELRVVLTTLASCFARFCAVEADSPRHAPSKRVTGGALTETNRTPTFRLSSRRHRRAGSVAALSAAECAPDGPHHGFTFVTETAATCALLQKHAPTIRNAFHRVSFCVLARRRFPSHRRRTCESAEKSRGPPHDPRACARRPSETRHL